MIELKDLLEMETVSGCKVKDIKMRGGHNLVMKLRLADKVGPLHLPNIYTKKSVGNLVSIKGLIVVSSIPYRPKVCKTKMVYSHAFGEPIPKSTTHDALGIVDSSVCSGDFIIYNSYNVGKIMLKEIDEPLVVVREMDILCTYPGSLDELVELGELAMTREYRES